jgi:hypothetical protein
MSRKTTLETMKEYFAGKGKFLTIDEYKEADDTPVRFILLKRTFGSWARLKSLVGEFEVTAVVEVPKQEAPKQEAPKEEAPKTEKPVATKKNG